MHCKPLSIKYVMYVYGLCPIYFATKNLHLATIFYHLVAKWRLNNFFNFEPCARSCNHLSIFVVMPNEKKSTQTEATCICCPKNTSCWKKCFAIGIPIGNFLLVTTLQEGDDLLEKLCLDMTGWLLIRMKFMLIQSQSDCVADRVKHLISDHWPDVVRCFDQILKHWIP